MRSVAGRLAVLLVLSGALACSADAVVAVDAKKTKGCKHAQVRRTFTYVTRVGGPKRRTTACVPRAATPHPSAFATGLPLALRRARATATRLAPAKVARLTKAAAARRAASADSATDAALVAAFPAPVAARAAAVVSESDSHEIPGPRGTRTTQTRVGVGRDGAEPLPGSEKTVIEETTATRVGGAGASTRKVMKLSDAMDRCPDAGGVARGKVSWHYTETRTFEKPGGGHGVIETEVTVDNDLTVHFNDSARIASLEVAGVWTWTTDTRLAPARGAAERSVGRHSVSGTVGLENYGADRSDGGARDVTLSTQGTRVTDAQMAVAGALEGVTVASLISEEFIEDALTSLQRRLRTCMKVVPEPATVHVKPGGSVAIGGRLTGYDGDPRTGLVTAEQGRAGGTVTPPSAEAAPTASFTYDALPAKPPGGVDTVLLEHLSRQGGRAGGTVTIIYDDPPKPPVTSYAGTFGGTWVSQSTGENWTFNGTVTFTDAGPAPAVPQGGAPGSYRRYTLQTGSADVSVTATSPFDGCGFTGSGTISITPADAQGSLTVQEVADPPFSYELGLQSFASKTLTVTKTGGPTCDPGTMVDYPLPGVWASTKSAHTSGTATIQDAEDMALGPFSYDVAMHWALTPAS